MSSLSAMRRFWSGEHGRSFATGARYGAFFAACLAIAIAPGRVALGQHEAQFGRSPTEYAVCGICRDVTDVLPKLALSVGAVLVLLALLRRPPRFERWAPRALLGLVVPVSVVLWFMSSAISEFKVQRGVPPTWFDLQTGAGDADITAGAFRIFLLRRHFVPGLVAIAAFAGCAILFRRGARSWTAPSRRSFFSGFAFASAVGFLLPLTLLDPHVRIFRTIADRRIVGEPFVVLFSTLGDAPDNIHLGVLGLVETATLPKVGGGEALLGLPPWPADRTSFPDASACRMHPFARELGEHEGLEPRAAHAIDLLERVSAALFEDTANKEPIHVWQVLLESFRGDDLHALNPNAPRELAPFVNDLYEQAARGEHGVLAFTDMWQGGVRTSQGLSSFTCGLGMMPYGISIGRDLGPVPLRCMPDILVDASFEPTFFYGGSSSFDDMDTYVRYHGIGTVVSKLQLPVGLPTGECGISDRAVLREAIARVEKAREKNQYLLLLSASNHVPFSAPTDLPPEVAERVARAAASPDYTGTADDTARLHTYAYTDQVVRELIDGVRRASLASRSIFVIGADHSTGDSFVWAHGGDAERIHQARAKIPFMIIVPDELVARAQHPEVVRDLLRELSEALSARPWSQNDVPSLVLALLSRKPEMMALPREWRFHTMGGQASSPHFRPPQSGIEVMGINSRGDLYMNDASGRQVGAYETASLAKPDEVRTSTPSLVPAAVTLQRFLKEYARPCRDAHAMRAAGLAKH